MLRLLLRPRSYAETCAAYPGDYAPTAAKVRWVADVDSARRREIAAFDARERNRRTRNESDSWTRTILLFGSVFAAGVVSTVAVLSVFFPLGM